MILAIAAAFPTTAGQRVSGACIATLLQIDRARVSAEKILATVANKFAISVVLLFAVLKAMANFASLRFNPTADGAAFLVLTLSRSSSSSMRRRNGQRRKVLRHLCWSNHRSMVKILRLAKHGIVGLNGKQIMLENIHERRRRINRVAGHIGVVLLLGE